MLQLETDTDFDEVMLSFEDEGVLRVGIEDSPYVVILNEVEQSITLQQEGMPNDIEEVFDEDGIESVIDYMASRLLTSEEGEDWHSEMIHYGV